MIARVASGGGGEKESSRRGQVGRRSGRSRVVDRVCVFVEKAAAPASRGERGRGRRAVRGGKRTKIVKLGSSSTPVLVSGWVIGSSKQLANPRDANQRALTQR